MKSKHFTTVLIHLSLGLVYLTSGFSKLAPKNLGNIIGPVNLDFISDSTLSWYFMLFVAVYQVIAGALTLSQRYSLVGLILLLPLSIGILIFTLVVEFGGTPLINLFILVLIFYALYEEKNSLVKILKVNFEGLKESKSFQRFPNQILPNISLGIIFLILSLLFLQNSTLNILLSLAILLFTTNLFQFKKYLLLDKIILILFPFISLFIINGHLINQFFSKSFAYVFLFIIIGIMCYFIRVLFYFIREKRLKK